MSGGYQGYPPPYSANPPGPPPPQMVTVTTPPTATVVQTGVGVAVVPVVMRQQMGPKPANIVCKSCGYEIVTRVETKPTIRTHLFALILCLIGCWPCVCVPYCMDSCNNAEHYCPNCNSYIGSYIN